MELFEMERNEGVPKSWQTLEIRFQPGLDSTPQSPHPLPCNPTATTHGNVYSEFHFTSAPDPPKCEN